MKTGFSKKKKKKFENLQVKTCLEEGNEKERKKNIFKIFFYSYFLYYIAIFSLYFYIQNDQLKYTQILVFFFFFENPNSSIKYCFNFENRFLKKKKKIENLQVITCLEEGNKKE